MSESTKTIQPTASIGDIRARHVGLAIALLLAFMWAFAGMLKIWAAVPMLVSEPGRFFSPSSDPDPTVWTDNFSVAVILAVACVEVLVAWFISSGKEVRGLLIGAGLLAVFLIAVSLWPIAPDSTCGCLGRKLTLPGTPVSRLALLGGIHAIALSLIARPQINKPSV